MPSSAMLVAIAVFDWIWCAGRRDIFYEYNDSIHGLTVLQPQVA